MNMRILRKLSLKSTKKKFESILKKNGLIDIIEYHEVPSDLWDLFEIDGGASIDFDVSMDMMGFHKSMVSYCYLRKGSRGERSREG